MREDQIKRLNALDADCRFTHQGPTFAENETTGKLRQVSNGGVTCEVIDRTVKGEPYARGTGTDETLALDAALAAAETAEKPLTAAQKADAARTKSQRDAERKVAGDAVAAATARAEAAEAELAAIKAINPTPPTQPGPAKRQGKGKGDAEPMTADEQAARFQPA